MENSQEKNVVNLSRVVCVPMTDGVGTQHMWTGMVNVQSIDEYMIKDPKARADFKRQVRNLEEKMINYRNSKKSVLFFKNVESESLEEEIFETAQKLKKTLLELQNAEKIDMDMFWIAFCNKYEEVLEYNKPEIDLMIPTVKKDLDDFRVSLNENYYVIREIYLPSENKYVCEQYFSNSYEKEKNKIRNYNADKFVRVIEHISEKKNLNMHEGLEILQEISRSIPIQDIEQIFENSEYSKMLYLTFLKNYLLEKGIPSAQIEKMDVTEIVNEVTNYNLEIEDVHGKLMADAIVNGLKFINVDKVLLISMQRYLNSLQNTVSVPEESDYQLGPAKELVTESRKKLEENYIVQEGDFNWFVERSKRIEYLLNKILKSGVINKRANFSVMMDGEKTEISFKGIEKAMNNFCDGMYLTDVIKLDLIYNAYTEEYPIEVWSDELIKKVGFTDKDKFAISLLNFENFKRLHKLGEISEEQIKLYISESSDVQIENKSSKPEALEKIEKMKSNSKVFLRNLYDSNFITAEEIKKYFEEGIISKEMLERLDENKTKEELEVLYNDLGRVFNQETLLEKYKQYEEKYIEFIRLQLTHLEDTEKLEELKNSMNALRIQKDTYKDLFNRYNPRKTEQEKHIIGDELLEKYLVEMDITDDVLLQETIKTLYEDGMVDLENIIRIDKDYVIPMLDKLSLDDASKIRNSMTFKELEELLDTIFEDKGFTDERKFIIVMNLLSEDTENDKTARKNYLKKLKFDNSSEKKAKTKTKREVIPDDIVPDNITKESKKYVYPDYIRWKFFKALDKDARVTRYANGFVEFASTKLGARIIEKYYDGSDYAYGTATYIMSEKDYREKQADLVSITPSGEILEGTILRNATPRKDRVIHRTQSTDRTWMDDMIKKFEIEYERTDDSRYTIQELKDLEKIVQTHKKDWTLIK